MGDLLILEAQTTCSEHAMESCTAHMCRLLVLYFTSGHLSLYVTSAYFFVPKNLLPCCRLEASSPVSVTLAADWKLIISVTMQQAGHLLVERIYLFFFSSSCRAPGEENHIHGERNRGNGTSEHVDLWLFRPCTILNRQPTRGGAA